MLNEGIHIESVDGVILLRPTESPIIFYQQIGRCLQVGNNNPIIFDLVNNFSSIKANNFLRDLNEAKNEEQNNLANDGIIDDIPEFKVTDETKEIVELFDSIGERLNTWEIWYNLLKEYHSIHKDCNVNHHFKFKGENLGFWVTELRRKKHRLSPKQIQKLDDLGFDWGEDRKMGPLDRLAINRRNIKSLEEYFNEHKTCKVPKREPKDENGKKFWSKELSVWFHHSLKPKLIKDYEKDKEFFTYEYNGQIIPMFDFLNDIGINEAFKKRVVDIALERLQDEQKKNPSFGKKDFDEMVRIDKKFFASVVNRLRNYYSGIRGLGKDYFLPGEVEKLESFGWTWKSAPDKTWNDYFEDLKKIYEATGSSNIKESDGHTLFQWCRGQRQKKNLLSPEQIEKLDLIEFQWELIRKSTSFQPKNNKKFEENASHLPKYKLENGEFKFKSRDKISNWVRHLKISGTTEERKKILLKYGFDLDKEIKKTISHVGAAY